MGHASSTVVWTLVLPFILLFFRNLLNIVLNVIQRCTCRCGVWFWSHDQRLANRAVLWLMLIGTLLLSPTLWSPYFAQAGVKAQPDVYAQAWDVDHIGIWFALVVIIFSNRSSSVGMRVLSIYSPGPTMAAVFLNDDQHLLKIKSRWVKALLVLGMAVQLWLWLPTCIDHWRQGHVWFDDFMPQTPFPALIWLIILDIVCMYIMMILCMSTLLTDHLIMALLFMLLSFANVTLAFSSFVLYLNSD